MELEKLVGQQVLLLPQKLAALSPLPFGSQLCCVEVLRVEAAGVWVRPDEALMQRLLADLVHIRGMPYQALIDQLRDHPEWAEVFVPFAEIRMMVTPGKDPAAGTAFPPEAKD